MRLRRHPFALWALAVALAAATALTVHRLVGQAAERAAALGGMRTVPVAARAVERGAALAGADVALRPLPAALLPSGPLARSPVGRVALVPLAAGEVLLAAKLAPEGLRGVAALVPPGLRALAVPVEPGGLRLRLGDRVDVLATFDTIEAGSEPTFPVVRAAVVVDVAEEAVTVAVTADEAPRVAFAVARGTVTLALAGAP